MRNLFFTFLIPMLIGIPYSYGQSPYRVDFKSELPISIVSGVTLGTGLILRSRHVPLSLSEIQLLDANNVNSFDRFATKNYATKAGNSSNLILVGSHLSPALFLLNKKSRKHIGQIGIMYLEAASLNLGLTMMAKSIIKRPRPFVYNQNVSNELKVKPNSSSSFYSGHTSSTALNTFFVAQVYADFFPDSKWKPLVWGMAATIPAVTGYFRISAGKHYPTDVITGYATGAAIGMLIPFIHKNKRLQEAGLQVDLGYNQAALTWSFN